jgi:hypothetical protein
MAQLGTKFNAQEHDTEQRDYENLPEGIYKLEVTEADVAATKKGDGTLLKLRYGVIEPEEYKGRLIFGNITLENPNAQAQEIGQKQLASLCRAIGLSEIEDSDELKFQSFVAKVGLSKRREVAGTVYEPRNECKRFYFPDADDMPEIGVTAANDNKPAPRAINDNRPASGDARTTGNGAAAATTAAGGKSRPWGRK